MQLKKVYCKNCKKKRELIVMNLYCSETCKVAFFELTIKKLAEKRAKKNKDAIEWQKTVLSGDKKKIKSEIKDKLKTLGDYEKEAKKSFQKYIRLRDKDLPCISCGNDKTDLWDGGHYKKAEIYSGVIFDEQNCQKQCRKCNRFLNGNELNYREGLILRYGIDYVVEIEEKAIKTREHKFTREELIMIKKKYDLLIKSII
jgi:hypothetical protein